MNKKTIVLVLLLVSFLTIMAISVWGKGVETATRVSVKSISIYDTSNKLIEEEIEDGTIKRKLIELDLKDSELESFTYTFTVTVDPIDATYGGIEFDVQDGKDQVIIEEVDYDTWTSYRGTNESDIVTEEYETVHYFTIKFLERKTIKINFYTTSEYDLIQKNYLEFSFKGIGQGDIIDF